LLSLKPCSILDIGGSDYVDFCKANSIAYTSINLETPQTSGTGGYHKHSSTLTYDGRNLPFTTNQFELVIVNFVLHHAAQNTLFLMNQIKNISSKYVLIGEDLSELDYDMRWHQRNYDHQPGGVFRSDEEWKILFRLHELSLVTQYVINRDDDYNKNHMYRCLYVLKKG
jgi:hypothetical protein